MIDISMYDITEEQVRLILNNLGIVSFFYILGVLCLASSIITYLYKGCEWFIKKRKEKKVVKND